MFDIQEGHGPVGLAPVSELDDEALTSVVRWIAHTRARLDALQADALTEVDHRGLHRAGGFADVAAWLAEVTHVHESTARRSVNSAGLVAGMPEVAAALAEGAITSDHVERLARCVDEVGAEAVAADAAGLVQWARETPAARFVRRVRRWELRQHERAGRPVDERARRQRGVSTGGSPVEGLGFIRARLPLEEFREVMNVLWALVREQWRAEKGDRSDVDHDDPTIPQRLADALVEMARRAAGANPRQRARPTVVVTIGYDELCDELDAAGVAHLDDGTPISAATARRLACEVGIVPAVLGGSSVPLDLGRSQRLASDSQRLAMMARSQTCEWPGCSVPATWCQAHHLDWWEHGGPTDLDNLVWACNGHHHLAHEGGWTMTRNADGTITVTPPPHAGDANIPVVVENDHHDDADSDPNTETAVVVENDHHDDADVGRDDRAVTALHASPTTTTPGYQSDTAA